MLKAEFITHTGYTPSDEEYYFIEQAYYDTDNLLKDDFCAQWLKDKASGTWDREMRVRKTFKTQVMILGDRVDDLHEELHSALKLIDNKDAEIARLNKIIANLKKDQDDIYNTVAAAKELLARL